jgi:hypothetical protein
MELQREDSPPKYSPPATPLTHAVFHPQASFPTRPRFLPGDGDEGEEEECPSFPGDASAPLPPTYSAFDDTINSFTLREPLVFTVGNSEPRPRYQLSEERSRSGKPYRVRIRRLLPTESRRLSLPICDIAKRRVDFDDDTTLYTITNLGALSIFKGQNIEMRGRRANTLPGYISFKENGEFWHITRNPAGDALKKENEKKMKKYGYRSDDEWNRKLLFRATVCPGEAKYDWRDGAGQVIAHEIDRSFDIASVVDQRTKDTLVTCWVARRWGAGGGSWVLPDAGLSRTASLNS